MLELYAIICFLILGNAIMSYSHGNYVNSCIMSYIVANAKAGF